MYKNIKINTSTNSRNTLNVYIGITELISRPSLNYKNRGTNQSDDSGFWDLDVSKNLTHIIHND